MDHSSLDEPRGALCDDDPNSFYNKCPELIQMALRRLPDSYLKKTEAKLAKDAEYHLDDSLALLRISIWKAYHEALEIGSKMSLNDIMRGACTKNYLVHVILADDAKVAYIITPPKSLHKLQELTLHRGMQKIRDALELNPIDEKKVIEYDDDGDIKSETITKKINAGVLREQKAIVAMLADRVQGSITSKVAIRATNDTRHSLTTNGPMPAFDPMQRMKALDAELKQVTPPKPPPKPSVDQELDKALEAVEAKRNG